MDFDIEHVKGLENNPIKSMLAEPRRAPDTMPSKPFLSACVASRGGGKTTSICNLVKLYAQHHFFDKVILLSPTFFNDPKLKSLEDDRYKLTVHTEITHELIDEIFESIKADIEEYKKDQEYVKLWKRLMAARNIDAFIEKLEPMEIVKLQEKDFQPPEIKWAYGFPQTLIICDDLVGCRSVYNNPAVVKFCLQHRHYLTSLIFGCQVWKNAVPRGVRNNLSLLMLFTNKSIPIRKEIAEELSAFTTSQQFMNIWDFACQQPHDFLMVNFDDPKHRFRRNFNELIHLRSLK